MFKSQTCVPFLLSDSQQIDSFVHTQGFLSFLIFRCSCAPLVSWASLVAQLIENLSAAMWETWVQSLGWEDLLEKGAATHSNILAWRVPWTVHGAHGVSKSWTQLSNFHFTSLCKLVKPFDHSQIADFK